tara:strand:- start:343 stop:498 length:156 start_codon:yes stop_codon:yes gene_type:complete
MQIKDEDSKGWALSLGVYPGILLGFRTYRQVDMVTHVLYIPFVDLALEIDL